MSATPIPQAADHKPNEGSVQVRPSALGLRSVCSLDLFGGEREILIEHANVPYRLRITKNDKLILTK